MSISQNPEVAFAAYAASRALRGADGPGALACGSGRATPEQALYLVGGTLTDSHAVIHGLTPMSASR